MRRLAAVLLVLFGIVAGTAMISVALSEAPPVSGPISLIGTVQEHHGVLNDHNFPGRETWYLSLSSPRAKGKKFGYGILACSFVSLKTTIRQCTGTYSLPRGKISVSGSFLYATLYVLAVTGGTDAYSDAGGNLVARKVPGTVASYWIDFNLTDRRHP